MHIKIINVIKKFFKQNDAKNINTDELTKEIPCIEDVNEKILIKSQQSLNVTHSQLKILKS